MNAGHCSRQYLLSTWLSLVCAITPFFRSAPAFGATRTSSTEQLRQLVRLPSIRIETGFTFDRRRGFMLFAERRDPKAALEKILSDLEKQPNDPSIDFRMGEIFLEAGDNKKATQAFSKAAELYERRLQLQVDNPSLLIDYGRALALAGQEEKAETSLRRATTLAPKDWRGWVELGKVLEEQAHSVLLARLNGGANRPRTAQPGDIEKAKRAMAEAKQCADRAVETAPKEPEVYMNRGMFLAQRRVVDSILKELEGREPDPKEKWLFTFDSVAEFKQAAKLAPQDYKVLATTAMFEALAAAAESGQDLDAGPDWAGLPQSTRDSVREAMTRLENLGQTLPKEQAARALHALATLQLLVLHDMQGAATNLRRTVVLDPNHDHAWDLLMALLAEPGHYQALIDLCEERVAKKDSPRNRILLAKAYEKAGQVSQAEANLLKALAGDPDNFTANWALGALFLRRADEPAALAQAGYRLSKADQSKQKSAEDKLELGLTLSIYYGLRGDLEQARKLVDQILAAAPDYDYAKQIKAALQ